MSDIFDAIANAQGPMTKPANICLAELMRLVQLLRWADPRLVTRRQLTLIAPGSDPNDILLAELILPRTIDLFLTYITDLVTLVCRTNPKTLSSRSPITVEEILEYDTMEALIESIIDKRVTELAYTVMAKLISEIKNKWGLDLFPDEVNRNHIVLLNEVRNLFVHNRGIVNKIFIERTGNNAVAVGTRLHVNLLIAMDHIEFYSAHWLI